MVARHDHLSGPAVSALAAWGAGTGAGTLTPVVLPLPLIGFVREYQGQRVLAVFNLSDEPVPLDVLDLESSMEGTGFEACIGSDGHLRPFGVLHRELATSQAPAPTADA